MKRHQLIVGILAVVHLILAVMVFCYLDFHGDRDYDWMGLLWFMLFPSQGCLIGIWTALGRNPPLRVMLTVVGVVVCYRMIASSSHSFSVWEAMIIYALQILFMSLVLLLVRLTGLEMQLTHHEPWKPKPFQFTIWQIMTWTAALAVIMSSLHYLPTDYPNYFVAFVIRDLLIVGAGSGDVALISIWLVFGKKWLPLRILAMFVAIGGGAWILVLTVNNDWLHFIKLLSFEAIWTILSLLVIRWAGYRMTWHWRLRRFKEPSEAAE